MEVFGQVVAEICLSKINWVMLCDALVVVVGMLVTAVNVGDGAVEYCKNLIGMYCTISSKSQNSKTPSSTDLTAETVG